MAKKTGFKEAPAHVGLKKTDTPNAPKITPAKGKARNEAGVNVPKATAKAKSASIPANNMPPTLEIADELQRAFSHFNRDLFNSILPNVVLNLVRLRKYQGIFCPKRWLEAKGKNAEHHEIGIDAVVLREKGDKQALSTLVHEMVHLAVEHAGKGPKRAYHCKVWAGIMKEMGLTPVIFVKGKPTNKETGANASHTIVKGGEFDKSCDALLKDGFKFSWHAIPEPEKVKKAKSKKAGVKVKYVAKCETAFWGKSGIEATCQCGCKSKFAEQTKDDDGDDE